MNNGISGYSTGGVNPYRQIESRQDVSSPADTHRAETAPIRAKASYGPDLSEAEAGMIDRNFPETERMRLRLYGPGREMTSVDPGERGRRLDLRG